MPRLFLLLLLCSTLLCQAQDTTVKRLQNEATRAITKDPKDTIPRTWRTGGLYNLAITQGSLSNWAAGGDNFSLALTSVLNLYAYYNHERHYWDNLLDFNLGYVNTTSLGARKNDDRLDFLSKYGYRLTDNWSVAGLFNFRSQLFKGYTYEDDEKRTFSSAFLSPAYITLSAGMDFKTGRHFSLFISPITTRWVVVANDSLSAQGTYGVTPGKKSNLEVGAFLTANYFKEFTPTVSYRGRLDLFSNYRRNPGNIDLFMTNVLALKLSRVLSFTWNVDFIYDDDVRIFGPQNASPALQVKSLLGAGLLVRMSNSR